MAKKYIHISQAKTKPVKCWYGWPGRYSKRHDDKIVQKTDILIKTKRFTKKKYKKEHNKNAIACKNA